MVKYAPILIPTLCRSDCFIRCIESLKKNTWAKYTDVYIALDYPLSSSHEEGYAKICKYLEGDFSCFANFTVFKREKNYGASKNALEAINYILNRYETFIRTDDDAEFSTNFLEYMNICLEAYKDDPTVIAVCGYSYPINWKGSQTGNVQKQNFVCSMWGTAFWRNKYLDTYKQIVTNNFILNHFKKNLINKFPFEMVSARYVDYISAVLSIDSSHPGLRMSDMGLGVYLQISNKFVVSPIVSKVRNHGFDNSGLYCQKIDYNAEKKISARNFSYSTQIIDTDSNFVIEELNSKFLNQNKNLYNKFDNRSFGEVLKSFFKTCVYIVLGEKKYKRLIVFLKHKKEKIKGR